MKKILTVIGARPQFIKASVVSRAIKEKESLKEVVIHTGQHFDHNMSQIFFDQLEIERPAFNLGVSGGNHGEQTGKMIIGIEEVILKEKPDVVLLYGDTNSTLAGSIAASKLHIPIAHVEAGLRSYNMKMPEEVNRILTDRISSFLFTPSTNADQNLRKEGIEKEKIFCVGDVMNDSAIHFGKLANQKVNVFKEFELENENYILITIHRAENTDDDERLHSIVRALESITDDYELIWPLHPRTRNRLKELNYDTSISPIRFIEPVGYLEMLQMVSGASLVITDSGGLQKETYFNDVRCLIARNETEWVELVDSGFNRLLRDISELKSNVNDMIGHSISDFDKNIYGDGKASQKIASVLDQSLNG